MFSTYLLKTTIIIVFPNHVHSEINNTQVDNAQDINVVMPMYNLLEYSNIQLKNLQVYGNTIKMNQL